MVVFSGLLWVYSLRDAPSGSTATTSPRGASLDSGQPVEGHPTPRAKWFTNLSRTWTTLHTRSWLQGHDPDVLLELRTLLRTSVELQRRTEALEERVTELLARTQQQIPVAAQEPERQARSQRKTDVKESPAAVLVFPLRLPSFGANDF